ncbi:T9SS type A sorting domain-containing protein [bacterium]|nr:T9SS type A sorting domain-containing protein [bacterium]
MRSIVVTGLVLLMAVTAFGVPDYVAVGEGWVDNHYYRVEIPARTMTSASVPLIVVMHGGGGTAEGISGSSLMYLILEQEEAVLVYPQGHYYGDTWVPQDYLWIGEIVDQVSTDLAAQTEGLTTVDPTRVYACGSSAGGWMAHCLAYLDNDRYAAIATVSGGWPGNQFPQLLNTPPVNKVGFIAFHNRWDQVIDINYGSGSAALQWSEWNGAPNYSKTPFAPVYFLHNWDDGVKDWVKLHEIKTKINGTNNHVWPHNQTYGIEPVALMWPFFMQFDRSDLQSGDEGPVLTPANADLVLNTYPNPFNTMGTVTLTLPEADQVRVTVHNMLGQTVLTLADGSFNAGTQEFVLDGSSLASGVYFVRADVTGQAPLMQKVVLLK